MRKRTHDAAGRLWFRIGMADPAAPAPIEDPASEALFAVIGVDATLTPGKLRITQEQRADAEALPMRLARDVKRFLTQDGYEHGEEPPAFDYKRALDALTESSDEQRVEELIAATMDDETAMDLVLIAGQAIRFLRDTLPKRSRMTVFGPETVSPGGLAVARFRRVYAVVNDPRWAMRDLVDGCLTRDQVRALQAVYPSLYKIIVETAFSTLVEIKAARKNARLPRRKVLMLEALLLTRITESDFARQLQGHFSEAEPEAQKQGMGGGGKAPDVAKGLQTQTQTVAGG